MWQVPGRLEVGAGRVILATVTSGGWSGVLPIGLSQAGNSSHVEVRCWQGRPSNSLLLVSIWHASPGEWKNFCSPYSFAKNCLSSVLFKHLQILWSVTLSVGPSPCYLPKFGLLDVADWSLHSCFVCHTSSSPALVWTKLSLLSCLWTHVASPCIWCPFFASGLMMWPPRAGLGWNVFPSCCVLSRQWASAAHSQGSGDPLGLSASTLSQTVEVCLSHSQVFLFQYSLPYSRCIVSVEIRNKVYLLSRSLFVVIKQMFCLLWALVL